MCRSYQSEEIPLAIMSNLRTKTRRSRVDNTEEVHVVDVGDG